MRRLPLALVLATTIVVAAAACSSGSDKASSTSTSSTSTTTTAAPTTTTASSRCTVAHLSATLGETQSGAGQRYTALVLTNTGSSTCELRGFPGVSLLDGAGTQIGQPAGREGAEGATVVLAPNASASSALHTSAEGMGPSCEPTSAKIRVYPPDSTEALVFAAAYTACGGFQVSTLVSGTAGR